MKCVFLDIDGVMNSASGKGERVSDMEVEKLNLLCSLIKETRASGIILTSDRRLSSIDLKSKKETFLAYGIPFLGVIRDPNPEDVEDNRGKQIMDSLGDDVERMVILDDVDDGISSLFFEDFVLVNRFYGLNEDVVSRAKDILGN
ncbi:MAG: hypothetical protein K6E59_02270 [Bacilli bacterium]|nr:hypothetical protein [Bacilli bacterium]